MDKYFELRVHAVQEAISRSRTIFLIVNLATVIVLSGLYNGYWSWMQHLVPRDPAKGYEELSKAVSFSRVYDTAIVSIPTIGLKFFVADLGLVAGFAMLVLAFWFYYSVRREQRIAGMLVDYVLGKYSPEEARSERKLPYPSEAEYALFALSSRFVFTTLSYDRPLGLPREQESEVRYPLFQWAVSVLIFAPFWTVVLCAAADIASLFFESRLLPGRHPQTPSTETLWDQLTSNEGKEAIGRILLTLILSICILRLVVGVKNYFNWTHDVYARLDRAVVAERKRKEQQALIDGALAARSHGAAAEVPQIPAAAPKPGSATD